MLRIVQWGRFPPDQTFDGYVAGFVVQGREQPAQRGERVRHRAAEHSTVDSVVERPYLDEQVDDAAQRGGQGRLADVPVARVGDHNDVGGEVVPVLLQQARQRLRAELLLALDEDDHAHRQVVTEGAQGSDVRHDAGLVVGGAAAEQPPVAFGGLKRVGEPDGRVADRLHVMVRIQQHGRGAGRRGSATDHRGMPAGPHDPHVGQDPAKELRHRLRASIQL